MIQDEFRRPHPESTSLIIGSAKKYLAKPEHRIQLGELVGETQRRLAERLRAPEFGVGNPWSVEQFRQRVGQYEAATEALMRLFGILGRWGDGNEFSLAADALKEFAHAKPSGGVDKWINLQTYPAVLALYGYGLGALKARRFQTLFQWLTLALRTNRDETEPAVARLLLSAWDDDERQVWKNIEGCDKHRTPLSDHLHNYLRPYVRDYLFSDREYEELFETFEILGGLAYLTVRASKGVLQTAAQNPQPGEFEWFPAGRSGWHEDVRETILASITAAETRSSLLKAGFARGDEEYLGLAIANMRKLMDRFKWM